MKIVVNVSVLAIAAATLVGCAATGDGAKWECSAVGLAYYHYTGSSHARIRLKQYKKSGSYAATKNASGTVAKGVTGNGTPFTCTKVTQ